MTDMVNGTTEVSRPAEDVAVELSRLASEFELTDAYQAERFAETFGENLRFDHQRRLWLVYREPVWTADERGEVDRLAIQAARSLHANAKTIPDSTNRGKALQSAKFWQSAPGVARVLTLAKSQPPIATSANDWNRDPWLLGTPSGVIDLKTGERRDSCRHEMVSLSLQVPYDPTAYCHRWEQFIGEVFGGDTELIEYLQRVLGYTLTGRTNEQVWWLFHGEGANGKSTLLEVVSHVLGDYAKRVPFSMFELSHRSGVPDDIATLVNKRFVTASESIESAKLNEARIKAMTGGDRLTARPLYGRWFEFDPEFKLFLCANHRPKVSDDSYGFWRRVHVVPFTQRFEVDRRDQALSEKLKAEGPGILNWLIDGCLLWQMDGLQPPDRVRGAVAEYERENNPLHEFLAERCEQGERLECAARTLFEGYLEWFRSVRPGEKPLSETAFGKRFGQLFSKRRTSQAHTYQGVRLKDEAP